MPVVFESANTVQISTSAVDITDVHFSDNTGEAIIAYLLGNVDAGGQFVAVSAPLILRLDQETLALAMSSINGIIAVQPVPDFYAAVQAVAYESIKELHGLVGGTLVQ